MAQSPLDYVEASEATGYLDSWTALASMIIRGRSLSGFERNCAFLNLGRAPDGSLRRFADVSAAANLDLIDDSRALSAGDWDGDGDLDFWLTNRRAPRVRFLKNNLSEQAETAWVSFALEGVSCNRDAIGAVLEFECAGRTLTRVLTAGDGFLSQSSKRVFFGLGAASSTATTGRLTVRWPGGEPEIIEKVETGRVYRIVQGSGMTEPLPPPRAPVELASSEVAPLPHTDTARIVLTERVAAPKIEYVDFAGALQSYDPAAASGPVLVNLWASWCAPCVAELADLAAHFPQLSGKGLHIVALTAEAVSADGSKPDLTDAKALVQRANYPFALGATDTKGLRLLTVLHNEAIVLERPLPLPSSFLLDRHGRLAVIYKGPVTAAQLQSDLDLLDAAPATIAAAAFPFPSQSGIEHFPITHLHFAKAYQDGGYIDDARRSARLTIEAKPSGNPAVDAGNRARAWYYLGTLEQGERNWEAAAEAYRKAIEFSPGQPLLEVARAVVLWQSGDHEAAQQAFDKAAAAAPGDPQVLEALAKANLQIGRPSVAVARLENALARKPGDLSLAVTLALAHEKAGNPEIAIAKYREILTAHPEAASVKNNLAYLLATTARDELRNGSEALALANEARSSGTLDDLATLDTLAAAQAECGDIAAALSTLERALTIARATGRDRLLATFSEQRTLLESGQPIRNEQE